MPIGGGGGGLDEKPLGAKGGYNLDMLDESAFGGVPPGCTESKPRAKPPARLAKKVVEEEKKEPAEDVIMADESKEEVKKPPPRKVPEKPK
jgi:hypothetical protein